MSDFLNWELTNKMHDLGYDGKTLMYIDDEEDIINDDSAELIDAKPAILTSAAFRWFREKYGLHGIPQEWTLDNFSYQIKSNREGALTIKVYGGYPLNFNTHEEAELACLKKLIQIVKEKL